MKRIICLFLALSTLFLTGCIKNTAPDPVSPDYYLVPPEKYTIPDYIWQVMRRPKLPVYDEHPLNGKKVIFIGNSFTYYGRTVLYKSSSVRTQKNRSHDKGYFYQLCKSRGAEVNVTNWTFSGHMLTQTFGDTCDADEYSHKKRLKDLNYDYVVIQAATYEEQDVVESVRGIMDLFLEGNPDTKFLFLTQTKQYDLNNYEILSKLDKLREMGVTVIEWGKLIRDIYAGNVEVPNAQHVFNRNTFIIRRSKADGFHPSMLTGYVVALMVYCAITDETAIGQDYSFYNDTSIDMLLDVDEFCALYYKYKNAKTTFPEIFECEEDMLGLQQLIDREMKTR